MLSGEWGDDLARRIRTQIGTTRAEGWGLPDLSANVLSSVCSQLSTLYDSEPVVRHADPAGVMLASAVADGGWWELAQRVQRDTLGLREMHVRIEVTPEGGLSYRPVPTDLVVASAPVWAPEEPHIYREARLRDDPSASKQIWTWDVFDISGQSPSYRILDVGGEDISHLYGFPSGGLSGEAYVAQWSRPSGAPFIPVVTYHAQRTGSLYDHRAWLELVEGTLSTGVLWSYYGHAVRDASHPQRYAVGIEVPAAVGTGDRHAMVADPATVLLLAVDPEMQGQPTVGQWQPGCDPDVLGTSIGLYERRVASYAGISESDFGRMSGDPRSGYALSISQAGARKAARRFEATFSRSDKRLLALSAAILGAAQDRPGAYPASGYSITYPGPHQTTVELLDEIEKLMALGMLHPADAYLRLHPHLTREQAVAALDDIARARRALAA
jgi:hypothetical protein